MELFSSTSKIASLQLHKTVRRPRLLDLLQQNSDRKLTLILGQAAQGKSTLAASYAMELEIPTAWASLGVEDSDSINLYYLLVHSLQRALRDIDFAGALTYPNVSIGPRAPVPLYRDWVYAAFRPLRSPVLMVLDGLDRLRADSTAFAFLQVLIDEAPPPVRFVLLSRAAPPLEIQRLKMSREAFVLNNADLAFTLDETRTFFHELHELSLSASLLNQIHARTEGWVGGLSLVSEALNRLPENAREDYFLTDGFHEQFKTEVFEYLGEQIFGNQPEAIQSFLVRSAMLDEIDSAFVQNFGEADNANTILLELSRKNLFVYSVRDPQRGTLFRYHQLFKDFLCAKFESMLTPEDKRHSFREAASVFEQKGDLQNAVKYYLNAGCFEKSAELLEAIGKGLLQANRISDLNGWFQKLPEANLQAHPWLLFYRAVANRLSRAEQNVQDLRKALDLFEEQSNMQGQILALAHLIEATVMKGDYEIPIGTLLAKALDMLRSTGSDDYPYERAVLWCNMGMGYRIRGGNPRTCHWACQNATCIAKNLQDLPLQVNALCQSLEALTFLGEFATAEQVVKQIDALMKDNDHPELTAVFLMHRGALLTFKGELHGARQTLEQAGAEAEQHGLIYLHPLILLHSLLIKVHLGEHAEVEQLGSHLLDLGTAMGNRYLQGAAFNVLGWNAYRRGELGEAEERFNNCKDIFASADAGSDYHLNSAKVMSALLCCHTAAPFHQAERELAAAIAYYTDISCHLLLVDAHLAAALLKWAQGRANAARDHLRTGFKIAAEKGYAHFLLLSIEDLVQACTLCLQLDIAEAEDYVKYLLIARFPHSAAYSIGALEARSKGRIKEKAHHILERIHRANVPLLRIRTLGRFRVFRERTPIKAKDWSGAQPGRLLKAIVAHGARQVPTEVLMEDLWPESSPRAAHRNLTINVHRLRKDLEPGMDKDFGSCYLHLKNNLISLDAELCSIDVVEFRKLHSDAKRKAAAGDQAAALALLKKAETLYGGPFLPEEPYPSWATEARQALQTEYLELLSRMAEIHEGKGAMKKASVCYEKMLQTDPLLEDTYRALMRAYIGLHMHNAALKVYEKCKTTLKTELGVEPEKSTWAILEKIIEK